MTPTPWSYGTGKECHNIYDANGALVCQVFNNLDDRYRIVKAVNEMAEREKEKA